ncbi:hypothetical protein VNI00_015582 [Paramarasmius palmivorus]|uniref:Uncharacterized protein n=1 Tax=Paramarasmius palmivorus TaxID=297713 RepID=A0AAW0BL34_9AGAR
MVLNLKNASTPPQPFPPELYYNILLYIGAKEHELTWLWTTGREGFKDAVERVFISRHINKTYLRLLHAEPSEEDTTDEARRTKLVTKVKKVFDYGNPPHRPEIVVQIRHYVNDTWVPSMEVDWDKLEVKIDWIGLYTEFFRETKEKNRRMGEFMESVKPTLIEMRTKAENGEIDAMEPFKWSLNAYGEALDKNNLEVRAERIARNVLKQDPRVTSWTDPNKAGAKRLKDIACMASCEDPYSDEGEDEDEPPEDDGCE